MMNYRYMKKEQEDTIRCMKKNHHILSCHKSIVCLEEILVAVRTKLSFKIFWYRIYSNG